MGSALKTADPYLVASSPLLNTVQKCIEDLLALQNIAADTCRELQAKLAIHAYCPVGLLPIMSRISLCRSR